MEFDVLDAQYVLRFQYRRNSLDMNVWESVIFQNNINLCVSAKRKDDKRMQ